MTVTEEMASDRTAVRLRMHNRRELFERLSGKLELWMHEEAKAIDGFLEVRPLPPFQDRVRPWMQECFGAEIASDRQERNHRFLEEALELVQACNATREEAHMLVDYVYDRPAGVKAQEVGGVMVTLAALCLAQSLDMAECGETELARVWGKVDAIREKQKRKPKGSPLPAEPLHSGGFVSAPPTLLPLATETPAVRDVLAERQRQIDDEGWTSTHDDAHTTGAMARAGAAYALAGSSEGRHVGDAETPSVIERLWPWGWEWWKPRSRRFNLVRAAALLLAEIERLDRQTARMGR